jgi:hypothetical protein
MVIFQFPDGSQTNADLQDGIHKNPDNKTIKTRRFNNFFIFLSPTNNIMVSFYFSTTIIILVDRALEDYGSEPAALLIPVARSYWYERLTMMIKSGWQKSMFPVARFSISSLPIPGWNRKYKSNFI